MFSYQGSDLRSKRRALGEERVQYFLIYYLRTLVCALEVRVLRWGAGEIPLSLVQNESIP